MLQLYTTKLIRDAAILTTDYVAGTVWGPADGGGHAPRNSDQLVIYVDFTKGSLTTAELIVEFSPDGTNYYQETNESVSGGTNTATAALHQMTATGAYRFMMPIKDEYIRISIKGTGTVTSSSAKIKAAIGTTA